MGFQHNRKEHFSYTHHKIRIPQCIPTGPEYSYRAPCDKVTISNYVTLVAWVWRTKIKNKKKNATFVISVRDLVKTNFLR